MTIFVSAVLYSVITRIFYIPEKLPRRRRSPRRPRNRWYEVWFNATVAPIVDCFLSLRGIICAAFATLRVWITECVRTLNDYRNNRLSPANPNGCERCDAQPLSAPHTPSRSQRSTRASQRATRPRAPPATTVSSSETSSPAPMSSLNPTQAFPPATRPRSPSSSPASSSGGSTLIGTPSRAPFVAPESTTTQATQRRGRPTRLCEIKAFIASSLESQSEENVSFILCSYARIASTDPLFPGSYCRRFQPPRNLHGDQPEHRPWHLPPRSSPLTHIRSPLRHCPGTLAPHPKPRAESIYLRPRARLRLSQPLRPHRLAR